MINWILFICLFLLFASNADAVRFVGQPECPYSGASTCSDGIDNDADGTVDESAPSSAWQADGDNYRVNVADCLTYNFGNTADATFTNGEYETNSASEFWNAEIACGGSFTNDTYDVFIYYSVPIGPLGLWVATSSHGLNPNNASNATVLATANTPTWANNANPVQVTGSNANFKNRVNSSTNLTLSLNGSGAVYIKASPGVRLACIYLRASGDSTQPTCPDESAGGGNSFYSIYKLSGSAPTGCGDSQFDNANILSWQGYSTVTDSVSTVKLLHDSTTIYLCAVIPDDDLESATTGDDDTGIFVDDRLEFQWRDSTATTSRDSTTFKLAVNAAEATYDANYPGGSADTSEDLSPSCSVSLTDDLNDSADDTQWQVFCSFSGGFTLSDGLQVRGDLLHYDRDIAGDKYRLAYTSLSGGFNDPANWPVLEFSGTAVPGGGGDTTPPTLTSPAVPSGTIEETTAIMRADTDEACTCVAEYDTNTGSPYTYHTAGTPSINGVCSVSLGTGGVGSQTDPPLTANTTYYSRIACTDASNNTGYSSEPSSWTTKAAAPPTCDYYASNSGGGDGSSSGSPFQIADFWSHASGGASLCLADGTYQGASSMIAPPAGLKGTSLNPIKITATNDGAVTIDGEGARRAIALLNDNDWFLIEGINAKDGNPRPIELTGGSDHNIIRRVVAWNCPVANNCDVFGMHGGNYNLFEDVAGFGTARKIFSASQSGDSHFVLRRAWGAWTQTHDTVDNPKMTFTITYNNYNAIYENVIGTWHEESPSGNPAGGRIGVFANDGITYGSNCANSKWLGSISYFRAADTSKDAIYGQHFNANSNIDCIHFVNTVSYIEPGSHSGYDSVQLKDIYTGETAVDLVEDHYTWIGGDGTDRIDADWQLSNGEDVATVGAASNIWNGGGSSGARVCYRYVDGVLTSTPLWPWPMDSRINAALTASGRDPDDYFGSGNTLTDLMESIFGTIPGECKS